MIVACAVGVASVIAAIFLSNPGNAAKEPFVNVTIEGLKETYKVGEPVDFVVKVEGYGCDTGFPSVVITKADSQMQQQQPVWSRFEIRHFPANVSCELVDLYKVRHIGDVTKYNNDEQERMRTMGSVPIILNEGKYIVAVERITPTLTKEFSVVSTG